MYRRGWIDKQAIILRWRGEAPIYQLRKVVVPDRHPRTLKDNEGNVPGRAVGKDILAKAEGSTG